MFYSVRVLSSRPLSFTGPTRCCWTSSEGASCTRRTVAESWTSGPGGCRWPVPWLFPWCSAFCHSQLWPKTRLRPPRPRHPQVPNSSAEARQGVNTRRPPSRPTPPGPTNSTPVTSRLARTRCPWKGRRLRSPRSSRRSTHRSSRSSPTPPPQPRARASTPNAAWNCPSSGHAGPRSSKTRTAPPPRRSTPNRCISRTAASGRRSTRRWFRIPRQPVRAP